MKHDSSPSASDLASDDSVVDGIVLIDNYEADHWGRCVHLQRRELK